MTPLPATATATRPAESPGPESSRPPVAPVERMALRLDELAASLGVSRRALERERSAGRFPPPDKVIGRMPLWRPATVIAYLEREGDRS